MTAKNQINMTMIRIYYFSALYLCNFMRLIESHVPLWEWKSLHSNRTWVVPPNHSEWSVDHFTEMIKPQKIFIQKVWQIENSMLNPGMTFDPHNPSIIYYIYRMPTKGKYERIGYFLMEFPSFKQIGKAGRIEIIGENDSWKHNLFGEDVRIIAHNYELYVYYNFHLYKKTFFYTKIHHNLKKSELYAFNQYTQVYFQKEDQIRHEKNWVAFEYCPHCIFENGILSPKLFHQFHQKSKDKDETLFYPDQKNPPFVSKKNYSHIQHSELFYIYGSDPHIVVKLYTTDRFDINLAEMCYVTEMSNFTWKWGEIRGGTQALPIDDDYYITFFHTRGAVTHHAVATYLMGAYLFQRRPPFAITHITPEPIVHETFYNESLTGWTYKNVDFVIFPMGLVMDADYFYVSYGRNDRNGWIMKIKRKEFLSFLIPVESTVLGESKMNSDQTDVLRGTFHYLRNSTKGLYVPEINPYIYNFTEFDKPSYGKRHDGKHHRATPPQT